MMQNHDLQHMLTSLGFKTPIDQIPKDTYDALFEILKNEQVLRHDWKIKRLLASSGIRTPQLRTFDQFNWSFNPNLPKQDLLAFKNTPWIEQGANLLLIGDTGLGKSHLAKALCYEAILQGHTTYFTTAFDLISKLKRSLNLASRVEHYGSNLRVLCLDELGYTYHSKEDTDLLFQIISKRAERLPTIITTNLAPKQWGTLFSGPAASAILDRISYNGTFITMEGKSYRLRSKRR